MLDFETLGIRADSAIISMGAVKFDPYGDYIDEEGFYASVSIDSNTEAGRHISEATLLWWMQQSPAAQKVFSEPKIPLATALDELLAFFDHPEYQVWSNGADFDIPMLAHAYGTHGLETPWKFWNARCFRTIKSLESSKRAELITNPLAHNALADAHTQARQLQMYFKSMNTNVKAAA